MDKFNVEHLDLYYGDFKALKDINLKLPANVTLPVILHPSTRSFIRFSDFKNVDLPQPVARDLRQISSALKMITDMERIGDQASDIAELSLQLGDVSDIDEISLIQKMANETMMMVVRGTEAYVTKDLDVAHNVIDNDDVVDDLFDQIKMALVKRIQDNHVKSFEAADLLMVAKYFERIGDHATNIAEWVIYSITGKHVDEADN